MLVFNAPRLATMECGLHVRGGGPHTSYVNCRRTEPRWDEPRQGKRRRYRYN
jgi:hypothetical protein